MISLSHPDFECEFTLKKKKKRERLDHKEVEKNSCSKDCTRFQCLAGRHIWIFAFCSNCSKKQSNKIKRITVAGNFQWSLSPWLTLLGSVRNGSYLCSLVGGVHSKWLRPTQVHHCCSAQPLLLLHHSPCQHPQRMRDPSFGEFEGGETGLHVTDSIPFVLKQCFHFISYVRNSGRDNKTFLLKALTRLFELALFYSLIVHS